MSGDCHVHPLGHTATMCDTETARGLTTVAVVLAAGAGTRFSGDDHKLLVDLGGSTLAARAIDAARRSRIGRVVVVTGAIDIAVPSSDDIVVVHNPDWADGQATSLNVGVRAAADLGASAVVVGLADQPGIPPEAWRRVAAANSPIAVATYDGRRRNPVRLDASVWSLLPTTGDEGARSVIRVRPELVQEVACPGSADDIDTREDLASWQNRSSTNSR